MVRIHLLPPKARSIFSGFYFENRSFFQKPENFEEICGSSSVGRASAFQAEGRGFEPRLPLQLRQCSSGVERFLGKEEVASSILATGSAFFVVYIL